MAEKKAAEEIAGYVKAADVASLLDITIQRVGQLRKEGVFKQYKTPAGDRYLLVETIKAYIKYLRSQNSVKTVSQWDLAKAKAEAELKQSKAEIARLQLAELRGTMHSSEDVEAITTDLVYTIRSLIMALPGRLAVDMANTQAAPEASIRIEAECHEILTELAGYEYDPEKYRERVRDREGWEAPDEDDEEE